MNIREEVRGIRTGKISEIISLASDRQCHLLTALARGAEELSYGKGWPDGVSDLIADLGRITKVNRVWLFQVLELTDKHMLMNFPFEWVDENTHALKKMSLHDTKHWDFETCSLTYRTLVESRKRGEWQIAIIQELDECDFKDYQVDQGVQSMLSIPVMVQGKWWGLLGLDDCTHPNQWSAEDIALVRMTAHLLSSAVLRNRLSSTNRQFEILSKITESSAWELDVSSGYCWCNSKIFSNISGLDENVHLSLLQVLRHIHPDDRSQVFSCLRDQIKNGELNFRKDLRILRDADYVWSEVIAKISLNADGGLRKLSGIIIDIPERKKKEEKLFREATLDPLTGIANRGAFDKRMVHLMDKLNDEGAAYSLVLLDIDYFKKVNDTWGHGVGDQALKHVAKILRNTLREGDFVARIGGEEFAMLLPCDAPDAADVIGERIRYSVEASPLVVPEATVPLTISVGIANATMKSVGLDCEALLGIADEALYEAKSSGRNRVVIR
ncbi:MAG: diguanylate cyclase [Desulfovibrio sp.]